MGQVTGGAESLGHMKRGIELLEGEIVEGEKGGNDMEEEGKEGGESEEGGGERSREREREE